MSDTAGWIKEDDMKIRWLYEIDYIGGPRITCFCTIDGTGYSVTLAAPAVDDINPFIQDNYNTIVGAFRNAKERVA